MANAGSNGGQSLRYWLKGSLWLFARGKILNGYGFADVQRFYTDGYFHRHFTKSELAQRFARRAMSLERSSVSHMAKRMIPFLPRRIDEWLENRFGWLLVGECRRTPARFQ
jgi:hypothetical protein